MNKSKIIKLKLIRATVENTSNLEKRKLSNLYALAYIVTKRRIEDYLFDEVLSNPKNLSGIYGYEKFVDVARCKVDKTDKEKRKDFILSEIDLYINSQTSDGVGAVNDVITIVESDTAISEGVKINDGYYAVRTQDVKEEYKTIQILDYILDNYAHKKIKVGMYEMFVKEAIEKNIADGNFKKNFGKHFAMHLFKEEDPKWFFENRIMEIVKRYIVTEIDSIKFEVLESELI